MRSRRQEVENQAGLFTLAKTDLLLGRILKAGFGDLYNVVPGCEIRQAQLAALRELPLKDSVERDSGAVLTGDDNERGQSGSSGFGGWVLQGDFCCAGDGGSG